MDLLQTALRQNWRAALLPGALEGLFPGFLIFVGVLIWQAGVITPGTLAILVGGILLFTEEQICAQFPEQIPVYEDEEE